MTNKTVYISLSADYLHAGHINVIKKASSLGKVTLGVLTDEAICQFKKMPAVPFEQRKAVVENIVGVDAVVEQKEFFLAENVRRYKPDYVVHGDDWRSGPGSRNRELTIEALKEYGGELVEIPYTKSLSSTYIRQQNEINGITPLQRMASLRRMLELKNIVRIIEVHNGLTGLIAENTSIEKDGRIVEFDGMWESSLTDSTSKGKPDTQAVDNSSRLGTIEQIIEVTTKPIVVDGDNGGTISNFKFFVRTLERLGVSAVIIEDKTGEKKNSLFGTDVEQNQDDIESFAKKISAGKSAQVTNDFMIIARIESLILEKGMNDALTRAKAYVDAGADGIMIHSRSKQPDEVLQFAREYRKFEMKVPLVCVPTTYSQVTESQLHEAGFKLVIYANHLLRSAFPAMVETAKIILRNERCHETDKACMPIKDIINLIPER